MVEATNLGFPRIGAGRELKKAVEATWKGRSSAEELETTAHDLRLRHWQLQKQAGLQSVPVNDFSLYDQVLDMACLLGCVPSRFGWDGEEIGTDLLFAMARGTDEVPALEMTKWFDTNYHYLVPEFERGQRFHIGSEKVFRELEEARTAGMVARPVLLGPLSFLSLGKLADAGLERPDVLAKLLPVYEEIFSRLAATGVDWVQVDEPFLALDLCEGGKAGYRRVYEHFAGLPRPKVLLATYFEGLRDHLDLACALPVEGLHLDLVRAPEQLEPALARAGEKTLSLGVVDGRNIWRNDLSASLALVERAVEVLGSYHVQVAPSCSLLHTPVDLEGESSLDPELKSWMAFAVQKLGELSLLARGATEGREAIAEELAASDEARERRENSPRTFDRAVRERMAGVTPEMMRRRSPFAERSPLQHERLQLPLYPTTTIGSFPQTADIRRARASYRKGEIDETAYREAMRAEIRAVVDFQEEIGLDVLVHGEPERNDMVEYFGEQLAGFAFTENGWVQSYGSRCVKPPVIYGDVSRPRPMTVEWATYAQEQTDRVMKGMLTGPVTILQWSFVRDDQPRMDTSRQIALAIRDEVADLERAGIRILQIDEAAFREGLPLRREDWDEYLRRAVENFRLASCPVADATQIHSHMCYSEFNDIIGSIAEMDADVISIETSRSRMELLDAFVEYAYPNEIGPGVYDIHSPRVPPREEIVSLLEKAREVLAERQIWVNPDCGLKTRGWAEVRPALENMVAAAGEMRAAAGVPA